jgi:UDP-N-acetyl-alpha-D-muramoyl-L-alanyl-L-glutamate epimerase
MSRRFDPKAFSALTIDGFDVTDGAFAGHYTLRGSDPADDVSFSETVNFGTTLRKPPDDRLLRLLTLTCVPSYYKAAAPPRIEIAFPTFDFERTYLRELIAGGLGEFAYRNDLPDALGPEITGPQAGATSSGVGDDDWDGTRTPLVPVGGGKDSVVTIEALKRHGLRPMLFSVNKFDPIDRCVEVSGLDSTYVTRSIDRGLIEVNGEGAYNGHVPVTAINSVIGLIVADANGLGSVVLSNERSSNVGNVNWMGRDINHQWSKSVAYETLLRNTLSQYGMNPDRYFSLLRGLSESEIADRFRTSPEYFRVFISCNRPFALDAGRRGATWCGHCPKCLFVFLLMGPRLGRAEVEAIFGHNLLADNDNRPGFSDIVGLGVHKPFECVGEYYEAAESLLSIVGDDDWRGLPLVEEFRTRRAELEAVAATGDTGPDVHYVPARYASTLDDRDGAVPKT